MVSLLSRQVPKQDGHGSMGLDVVESKGCAPNSSSDGANELFRYYVRYRGFLKLASEVHKARTFLTGCFPDYP